MLELYFAKKRKIPPQGFMKVCEEGSYFQNTLAHTVSSCSAAGNSRSVCQCLADRFDCFELMGLTKIGILFYSIHFLKKQNLSKTGHHEQ